MISPDRRKPGAASRCERRPDSVRLISYVSMPAAWCRFSVCLLHAAAPVVCCILCVRLPCCALVVEYNASRMLLVVRCPLLEMRRCCVLPVASRVCLRPLACHPLSVARCLLHALSGCAVFRAVSAACRVLPRCLVASLPVVNGLSRNSCCMPHVARCMLHAACCVARRCCPLHVA